jgi:hypothetical protein
MRIGVTIFPGGETLKISRSVTKCAEPSWLHRMTAIERSFASRVDGWFVALVFAAAALPLGAAGWLALHGVTRGVPLLTVWGVVMVVLGVWLGFPVRYTLRSDALEIHSGALHWTVPYTALRGVAATWVPLPGPAWSLRRVRLDFSDGFILVSPDDRESFISELAERCPHLVRAATGRALRLPLPHEKAAR